MKYLYVVLIVLCWSINPFLKKIVNKNILPIEFSLYSNSLIFAYLILYSLYQNKYSTTEITLSLTNKLTKNEIGLMFIVSLLTLIPSYLMTSLIKTYNVSGITSIIQSLNIICVTIIDVAYMGNPINLTQIGGLFLTSAGIYLLQ